MLQVLSNTWALLLGMFLLMIGNGLQGTLLGVRGEIEGFPIWKCRLSCRPISLGSWAPAALCLK